LAEALQCNKTLNFVTFGADQFSVQAKELLKKHKAVYFDGESVGKGNALNNMN